MKPDALSNRQRNRTVKQRCSRWLLPGKPSQIRSHHYTCSLYSRL